MLPFSKIACVQCRHFAIRSFASAAAASAPSASTSSSNPASTPLPSVKAGQQLAGSSKHASNPAQRSSKSPSYSRSRRRRRSSAGQSVLRSKQPSPTVTDLLPKQQELEQEHRQSPEAAEATKAVLKSIQDHKARAEKAASKVGGSGSRKKRPKKRAAPKIVHKRISRKTFMPVVSLRTAHEDRANRKGKSKTADRSQDKVAEKTEPTIRTRDREDAGVRPTNASSKVSDKQQNDIANVSGFTTRDFLIPSSESGFITSDPTTPRLSARTKYGFTTDFVEDDSEDGLSSAIAEMEELVNKVDSADESLKSLFARYLDTNLDASQRLDLLDEIKNHLSSLTLDAENASFEDDYLKIVATAQKIANNTEAAVVTETLVAPEVIIDSVIPPKEAEIAQLAHGLQRVLFNPGIHWLQHPRTGTYNFTKNVQKVADRDEFDFQRLPKFVRPSQDADLRKLLKDSGRKFAGSTSSLTSAMSQIYYALNSNKKLNTQSPHFEDNPRRFGAGARLPASIVLRLTDEGTYLVDADKSVEERDRPDETILSDLGHVLERQLTMEPDEFSRFLRSSTNPFAPHEMREKREAYHYSASKKLVMRSQLDCHDSRLPRKTFDIKTRATVAIRMDMLNHLNNRGYLISKAEGDLESFEREKYDLVRSAFLKYSMQVRIGQMDGIFLAYHSTGQIFGFEYLSLEDLDKAISGSHEESTQAFHLCVGLLENIFERVTTDQPNKTLRLHLQGNHGTLQVYAEARPDLSLSSAEKNEDSNDATATPFQPKDEFKDANDTPDVNTDGIRSYTFNITNILNGKEVKAKQPVDFVALARSMHAEAEEAANSSSLPDQDQQSSTTSASTTSEVSAFASRLRKYEEDEERQSSASQVTTSTASEQEYLSKIVWSIKYDIVESTDRYEVMKGLARLRKLQATFGNYVLLPEGLPSSLVRNLVYGRTKKEPTEEAEVEEKEQTSVQASGENEADTKRESDESGKKEEEKEDEHESKGSSKDDTTNGGSGKVLTWLEKWKAYQPREGVRFTTTPSSLISQIRTLAARGRSRMRILAKERAAKESKDESGRKSRKPAK